MLSKAVYLYILPAHYVIAYTFINDHLTFCKPLLQKKTYFVHIVHSQLKNASIDVKGIMGAIRNCFKIQHVSSIQHILQCV